MSTREHPDSLPESPGAVLVLDQSTSYPLDLCRALGKRGWRVDVFARPGAPAFRSRYCARRHLAPAWFEKNVFLDALLGVVGGGSYDAIFLSSEEVLTALLPVIDRSDALAKLLLPARPILEITLSKNSMIRFAADNKIPVPHTIVPETAKEAESLIRDFSLPMVVKGEKGGGSHNVRIARSHAEAAQAYRELREVEAAYEGRPALQEFLTGPVYVVGGVFQAGRPLRLCAHKILLMNPPVAGTTVKGITECPEKLIRTALDVFQALHYTGLGQADFVFDPIVGEFKLLEINPRLWASIGVARLAGVDFYGPYIQLARGETVEPDLSYREGLLYHRLSQEVRYLQARPSRAFGLIRDTLSARVHSDVDWRDLRPHLRWRAVTSVDGRSEEPTAIKHVTPSGRTVVLFSDASEWNENLLTFENPDIRQGFEWGELRRQAGWTPYRVGVYEGERCVAMISIAGRNVPGAGRSVLYASRGPVLRDFRDWEGLQEALEVVARESRAIFLRLSPDYSIDDEATPSALRARGFRLLPDAWTTWNAPRIVMITDLRYEVDELRARLRRRFRTYVSTAESRGLVIREETTEEALDAFHERLIASAKERGYPVRGISHFRLLWSLWIRRGNGVLLLIEKENELVGGLLGVRFGKRAYMLHSWISSSNGRPYHQGPPLYWHFICWAKQFGCESLDWGGSGTHFPPRQDDPMYGLYQFKLGFASTLVCMTNYHDRVFKERPYAMFRFAEHKVLPIAWKYGSRFNR